MKYKSILLLVPAFLLIALLSQSCLNDGYKPDDTSFPNGMVTVKMKDNKTVYLQWDDKTTFLPVNIKEHPFNGKEVRAWLNFKEVNEPHEGFTKAVHVNWIDSILTKPVTQFVEADNKLYGNDHINIRNNLNTAIEDGYLNLALRTIWGNSNKRHRITLLTGTNSENPYELELRHNAYGDIFGYEADVWVAFNLDNLPNTNGETVNLTLKWRSFMGYQTYTIKYKSKEKEHVIM